jgi:hypothetical protein
LVAMTSQAKSRPRCSPQVRECAVRSVREHRLHCPSEWAALTATIDCKAQTLLKWQDPLPSADMEITAPATTQRHPIGPDRRVLIPFRTPTVLKCQRKRNAHPAASWRASEPVLSNPVPLLLEPPIQFTVRRALRCHSVLCGRSRCRLGWRWSVHKDSPRAGRVSQPCWPFWCGTG